jgi:hypothetical protein
VTQDEVIAAREASTADPGWHNQLHTAAEHVCSEAHTGGAPVETMLVNVKALLVVRRMRASDVVAARDFKDVFVTACIEEYFREDIPV